jgi:hypothetical protein
MLGQKDRRDLKPDAQGIDKIIIETVPRWKDSEFSGSEWRISAVTKYYRKGKLIKETYTSNVNYAAYMVGARLIQLQDEGLGYFAGEGTICDQEGCESEAKYTMKKKFDFCRDGHKSDKPSNAYRLFCERHSRRGDCGFDDSDSNYCEKVELLK